MIADIGFSIPKYCHQPIAIAPNLKSHRAGIRDEVVDRLNIAAFAELGHAA